MAQPRLNAATVMKRILERNQGPEATAKAFSQVGKAADTEVEKAREDISGQKERAVSGLTPVNFEQFKPAIDTELQSSAYETTSLPTLMRIQGMQRAQPTNIGTPGIDIGTIKQASYINPSGVYSPGMASLDRMAFERAGGDAYITRLLNQRAGDIEASRAAAQSDVDRATAAYNQSLENTQSQAKSYVERLVEEARKRKQEEELNRPAGRPEGKGGKPPLIGPPTAPLPGWGPKPAEQVKDETTQRIGKGVEQIYDYAKKGLKKAIFPFR